MTILTRIFSSQLKDKELRRRKEAEGVFSTEATIDIDLLVAYRVEATQIVGILQADEPLSNPRNIDLRSMGVARKD